MMPSFPVLAQATTDSSTWSSTTWKSFAWGALALLAFPLAGGLLGVTPRIASEVLIIGLFALGVNLVVGHTGIVSFGHGLFFGVSVYVAALFQNHVARSLPLAILLGTIGAVLTAAVVGALIIRKRGIYFSLLTLAFSQMFFYLANRSRFVGGEDGLAIPGRREIFGLSLVDPLVYYYFAAAVLLLAVAAMWMLLNSPFGRVLQAIRDNEDRVRFLGLDVQRYVYASFIASAAFAGLAGGLYAFLNKFAFPQVFYWSFSGEVVVMILIGGMHTLVGPIIGSAIFMLLRDIISTFTERWMIPIGLSFVIMVLLKPEGVVHLARGLTGGRGLHVGRGGERKEANPDGGPAGAKGV